MASLVNPSNINGNFPIAGQDNDSQGFRDNFTNIRNNFTFIKSEVEDLQAKAVLKSALTGTTLNNDFQGSKVKNLQVSNLTETVLDLGQFAGGELQIDLAQGNIIKLIAPTSVDIQIADVIRNWPSSLQHARILLYINFPTADITVKLPGDWSTDLSSVPGLRREDGDLIISYTDPGDYIYEIASPDSGTTVFFRELTKGNAVFRDPNFYMVGYGVGAADDVPLRTGMDSPTLMIGFGEYLGGALSNTGPGYLIDTLKDSNDTLLVKGSISSYQNQIGDVNDETDGVNSLTSAGFSVVKDRTFIDGGLVSLANVSTGDLLGYYNAIGYTYDNLGATTLSYQQLGSIQFVAEGVDNSPLGIGGKILIKTKGDGTADAAMPDSVVGAYNYNDTQAALRTAIEIDNKQNVTIYGNLAVMGQTTVVESTTVTVEDKNLVLGQGGTESTNQGAGITVYSAAADGGANLVLHNAGWLTNRALTIANTSPANALVVNGNARVGGNLYVDGSMTIANIIYQNIEVTTSTETIDGVLTVNNNTPATSTTSAAVIVDGGIGIADGLYVNGTTYAQNFSTANALITGGDIYDLDHLASANGAVLTFTAANFSSANTWLRGGVIGMSTDGTVQPASNIYVITQYAGNFSTPNAVISGGSISGVSFSGITLPSLADVQISNAFITSGAIGMAADGTTSAVANVYAGTGQFTNLSSSNLLLASGASLNMSAATTLVGGGISGVIGAPSGGNLYIQSANLNLRAGTTAIAPIRFASGTNLTTPVTGAVEYDGTTFFATPSATTGRGIVAATSTLVLGANVPMNNGSATFVAGNSYSVFGGPIGGAMWNGNLAVAASTTYEFEGKYHFRHGTVGSGASATSTQLGFTFSVGTGTATVNSYNYQVTTRPGPFQATLQTQTAALLGTGFSNISNYAGTTVLPPQTAASLVMAPYSWHSITVEVKGIIRTNAAGNLVPVVHFITTVPGVATDALAGSYTKITPIGAGTGNLAIGSFGLSAGQSW